MAIEPIKLAIMLGISILCGVLLSVFYELSGVFVCLMSLSRSKSSKNKQGSFFENIFIFFRDLIFCFIVGVVLVLIIYLTNDGEFRIMAPIGLIAGGAIGHKILGKAVKYFVLIFSKILFKFFGILFYPVLFLIGFIKKLFIKLMDALKRKIKSIKAASTSVNTLNGIKRRNGKKKLGNISEQNKTYDSATFDSSGSSYSWNIH